MPEFFFKSSTGIIKKILKLIAHDEIYSQYFLHKTDI